MRIGLLTKSSEQELYGENPRKLEPEAGLVSAGLGEVKDLQTYEF
jgi:aryl carrier-like protein